MLFIYSCLIYNELYPSANFNCFFSSPCQDEFKGAVLINRVCDKKGKKKSNLNYETNYNCTTRRQYERSITSTTAICI